MKKIIFFTFIAGLIFMGGCDPNKDLYNDLDELQQPYNKQIEYTLVAADYNSIGGEVSEHQAFTEEEPPMEHIPEVLSSRFLALNLSSSAMVNFNFLLDEPLWEQAGFGYVLTSEDYDDMGVPGAFSPNHPPENNLPGFLLKEFPNAEEGDQKEIIYNFIEGGIEIQNLDTYEFDGSQWIWIETLEDLPFIGYEMTAEDYEAIGGGVAQYHNFSDNYPADVYVPVWLKNKFPFAVDGDEQVVKYRVFSGGSTFDEIAHYVFDGLQWHRTSNIEVRSEQYVFGSEGWAFDPTTRFIMSQSDYLYLAEIDPIPHAVFDDFGYYYGASAHFSNFDMRLEARRVEKDDDGNYIDPELGEIFENEGREATVEEMFRRIVEEGLIKLLQHKYPDAVPEQGGIDVHYIVGFETFNDNYSRSYLEAEYRCTAAGDPPQFELIEGPRDRE